jgi:hypothetical protein
MIGSCHELTSSFQQKLVEQASFDELVPEKGSIPQYHYGDQQVRSARHGGKNMVALMLDLSVDLRVET